MANKLRGESVLKREEGDDLLLIFDVNAFALLESPREEGGWDMSMKEVLAYISTWSEDTFKLGDLITLFWACAFRNHRFKKEDAGDIISWEGQDAVVNAVMEAVQRAMPQEGDKPPVGETKPPVTKERTARKK